MRLHAFLVLLAVTLALAVSLLWFWNMLKPLTEPDSITPPAALAPAPDPGRQLRDLVAAHEASLASLTPAQLEDRAAGLEAALEDHTEGTAGVSAGPVGNETE